MPTHAMSPSQMYRVQELLRDHCPEFGGRLPTEHAARCKCADLVSRARADHTRADERDLMSEIALTILEGF